LSKQNAISLEHDLFAATAALAGQIMDLVSGRTHRTVVECIGQNDPYRNAISGGSNVPLVVPTASVQITVPTATAPVVVPTYSRSPTAVPTGPSRSDAFQLSATLSGIFSFLWVLF
jgi:hypothetical protein